MFFPFFFLLSPWTTRLSLPRGFDRTEISRPPPVSTSLTFSSPLIRSASQCRLSSLPPPPLFNGRVNGCPPFKPFRLPLSAARSAFFFPWRSEGEMSFPLLFDKHDHYVSTQDLLNMGPASTLIRTRRNVLMSGSPLDLGPFPPLLSSCPHDRLDTSSTSPGFSHFFLSDV